MKNIFEGAKFGDLFVARNGNQACYLGYDYRYKHPKIDVLGYWGADDPIWDDEGNYMMDKSTDSEWDIVGEGSCDEYYHQLHNSIDEEKLDKLAFEESPNSSIYVENAEKTCDWIAGFKAGYRKAMEKLI